jgi:hypothetical protein
MAGGGSLALVAVLVACGQEQEKAAAPAVEDMTVALAPSAAPVRVAFLAGELNELQVTARVEPGTGRLVTPPVLKARLKLKNDSPDQAAQLVSGRIEYVDREGNPIPLEEHRGAAAFRFWGPDRLDPGMETNQTIEVPFPADALEQKNLRDIRLGLTYLATPYREQAVSLPVALGG